MSELYLTPMTKELCHTFYKQFEYDPDVFMDMSLYKKYQYQEDKVTGYFEKQQAADRLVFMVMMSDEPIGEVKLKGIDLKTRECTLGIAMQNDRYKGKGYGTIAEMLAVRYAFDVLGMKAVNADVVLKNRRSQHVLEKVGFWYVRTKGIFKYYRLEKESVHNSVNRRNEMISSIIMTRSSYRGTYLNIPVSRDDLRLIMEAGLAAPSGCNKQTTSLIAVDDPRLLEQIKEVIDPPICETAPAVICVLTQTIYAYRNKCYKVQDYSAAIENMLLQIKALGYESCWYEGHITDEDNIGRKIADILGVPKDYDLVCILPIGYAAEALKQTKKKCFDERTWFNGFGK